MITVSISSYNQKDYLLDCLESVLNQTVKPEILVIDDGSTDGSLALAHKFPVKVISQVNKGLPSARNTGIMNATGDYILFLDSDDTLEPHCIERMQQEIDKTSADIIAPEFKTFGKNETRFVYAETPTLEMFVTGNRLPYFCAIKKTVLLECGGYSPRMTWGYEDYALWFDMLTRKKTIALIREPLVNYRLKEHSMIHDAQAHHAELMAQIRKDYPHAFA